MPWIRIVHGLLTIGRASGASYMNGAEGERRYAPRSSTRLRIWRCPVTALALPLVSVSAIAGGEVRAAEILPGILLVALLIGLLVGG